MLMLMIMIMMMMMMMMMRMKMMMKMMTRMMTMMTMMMMIQEEVIHKGMVFLMDSRHHPVLMPVFCAHTVPQMR